MTPEKSREYSYEYIKKNRKSFFHIETNNDVKIVHNLYETDSINQQLSDEIVKSIMCVVSTVTMDSVSSVLDSIILHHISDTTIMVIIKPYDNCVGFVSGRQMNNLFAIKRLISNISGKYKRLSNSNVTITVDVHHLME